LLSVWPIVYFFLFLGLIGYVFVASPQNGFDAFRYIFLVHIATFILMFALMATYLVHLFRDDRLPSDRRILWALVLLLFGIFAFPVYWWLYVRPGAEPQLAST
jgi:predicted membrane channel-forming protein YqfA (hemolysin III family)